MSYTKTSAEAKGTDALWPFIMVYAFMWAGMFGMSLNNDPIKMDYNLAVVLGLACVLGIVVHLAIARLRRQAPFSFGHSTIVGNLAWHVFVLTGIVFFCFLCFVGVLQIMVLSFGAPVFESGCAKISQRDVALFVWDAMAKGMFKFLAGYLHLPAEACAPSTTGWTATISAQCIRWFTALVVVWYVVGFAKAWYLHMRRGRDAS
jgi:hypothetical protein